MFGIHRDKPHFMDNNTWNCFPKVDLNKFDGSNPLGWVTPMKRYFALHGITNDMMKLKVGILHLDLERWQ